MGIPDFLKKRDVQPSELFILIKKYEEMYGNTWATEGYDIDAQELTEILKECVKEHKTFSEVTGIDLTDIPDDELW